MEALPIFLDKICPSPVVAILLSVTLVLFFGEVIPQALCKAYGLQIGASTACFVKALMSLLYPIVWPIAKILDYLFGEEAKSLRRIDWVVKFGTVAWAILLFERGVVTEIGWWNKRAGAAVDLH